jgi:hypothetical protein
VFGIWCVHTNTFVHKRKKRSLTHDLVYRYGEMPTYEVLHTQSDSPIRVVLVGFHSSPRNLGSKTPLSMDVTLGLKIETDLEVWFFKMYLKYALESEPTRFGLDTFDLALE